MFLGKAQVAPTALTLLLLFVVANLVKPGVDGNEVAVNREEFHALCHVFLSATNVLNAVPEQLFEGKAWSEVEQTRRKIEDFGRALNSSNEDSVRFSSDDFQLELKTRQQKKRVFLLLRHASKKITRLAAAVTGLKNEARGKLQAAQEAAKRALYGTGAPPNPEKALTDKYKNTLNRGTVCVNGACSDATAKAGCSLLHDVMCLCTNGQSGRNKGDPCAVGEAGESSVSWYDGSSYPSDPKTAVWDKFTAACRAESGTPQLNGREVTAALRLFQQHLGRQSQTLGTSNPDQRKWILGFTVAGGTCTGGSSNGLCINYGVTGSSTRGAIAWEVNLNSVVTELDGIEAIEANLSSLNHQAYSILLATEDQLVAANASDELETSYNKNGKSVAGEPGHTLASATPQAPTTTETAEASSKIAQTIWLVALAIDF